MAWGNVYSIYILHTVDACLPACRSIEMFLFSVIVYAHLLLQKRDKCVFQMTCAFHNSSETKKKRTTQNIFVFGNSFIFRYTFLLRMDAWDALSDNGGEWDHSNGENHIWNHVTWHFNSNRNSWEKNSYLFSCSLNNKKGRPGKGETVKLTFMLDLFFYYNKEVVLHCWRHSWMNECIYDLNLEINYHCIVFQPLLETFSPKEFVHQVQCFEMNLDFVI